MLTLWTIFQYAKVVFCHFFADQQKLLPRLNIDSSSGGAWCPSGQVSARGGSGRSHLQQQDHHYLQVDLPSPAILSAVQTQGRFGGGRGREFAQAYELQYRREGQEKFRLGRCVLFNYFLRVTHIKHLKKNPFCSLCNYFT